MDTTLIRNYHAQVETIIRHGGSTKETSIRTAFMELVGHYARPRGLELVPEIGTKTPIGTTVYPDGTLKDKLRQDWGMVPPPTSATSDMV